MSEFLFSVACTGDTNWETVLEPTKDASEGAEISTAGHQRHGSHRAFARHGAHLGERHASTKV
jgi:hypothetical protein